MLKRIVKSLGIDRETTGHIWHQLRYSAGYQGNLPDFLIIGAQKCGTTSLFQLLIQHPQISPPLVKEIHFFENADNFSRGPKWYRAYYPQIATDSDIVTGEATPFMYHRAVPARVAKYLIDIKLIIVLRDPVKRAWSHYLHNRRQGSETLPFDEAVTNESNRIKIENQELETENESSLNYRRYGYLSRGLYAEQLNMWSDHFPSKDMLVVFFDDLLSNTNHQVSTIYDHLQIDTSFLASLPHSNRQSQPASLDSNAAQRLYEFFRGPDDALRQLLGRELPWRQKD